MDAQPIQPLISSSAGIHYDYDQGHVIGWLEILDRGLAKREFNFLSPQSGGRILGSFDETGLYVPVAETGKKVMLYLLVRKAIGKDITNYPQQVGDCVSFGAKNAAETLQAVQTVLQGEAIKWRPVFPPYYYGTGRVYVGRGQLGYSDGSLGVWMAEAVTKYGTLFADEPGVPQYSGSVARRWGDPVARDDLDIWKPKALAYLVKQTAPVRTWPELVAAITNGYPVTIASDVGFTMEPGSDGFHRRRGSWAHQMCIIGVCDTPQAQYAIIQNSWGDVHGRLKDFDDGHDLPLGCLRVRRPDVEVILAQDDSFAYSHMVGFPDQSEQIDREMFRFIKSS